MIYWIAVITLSVLIAAGICFVIWLSEYCDCHTCTGKDEDE